MTVDRQFPRYAIDAQIALRDVAGVAVASGQTRNLSRGGLCAEIGVRLALGVRVDVQIALVFAAGSVSEPLVLPARVVWSTSLAGGHQTGIAFLRLTEEQLRYLDMFIRFLADDPDDDPADQPGRPGPP